jgi:hypothetical protein
LKVIPFIPNLYNKAPSNLPITPTLHKITIRNTRHTPKILHHHNQTPSPSFGHKLINNPLNDERQKKMVFGT